MSSSPRVVHEAAHRQLSALCGELGEQTLAQAVLLFAPTGETICQWGTMAADADLTSLGALAAGTMAASGALARVLGHAAFAQVLHEADGGDSLHLTEVAGEGILVVVFDRRAAVGLVRLRASQLGDRLRAAFASAPAAAPPPPGGRGGGKGLLVSEQDIDNLFGD